MKLKNSSPIYKIVPVLHYAHYYQSTLVHNRGFIRVFVLKHVFCSSFSRFDTYRLVILNSVEL